MRLYDYRAAVHRFFYLRQRWGGMLLDGYFDISFITPRVLILYGRHNFDEGWHAACQLYSRVAQKGQRACLSSRQYGRLVPAQTSAADRFDAATVARNLLSVSQDRVSSPNFNLDTTLDRGVLL